MNVLSGDDFLKRVNMLVYDEFDDLNIKPCELLGLFQKQRLNELKDFCKKNPQYHIISYMGQCIRYNKPMENAYHYTLGSGDANPDLIGVRKVDRLLAGCKVS